MGRVGVSGPWTVHLVQSIDPADKSDAAENGRERLLHLSQLVADMISNNPLLCTPTKDSQAIDINIACLFLVRVGCNHVVRSWISQIAHATVFAFRTHGLYPCVHDEYRELVDHPKLDNDYRVAATTGSILIPMLAVWAAITEDSKTLDLLAEFVESDYAHSNLQVWYPGADTEEHLYHGSANHGLCAHPIRIARSFEDMLSPMRSECEASNAFVSLSVVERNIWPLIVVASRHHRVPVPPHFWLIADSPGDVGPQ